MPPSLGEIRSSKAFVIATLCLAFFTDDFIYGIIVPVLPFSLPRRSYVPQHELQFWTSAMLTAFGLANLISSRQWLLASKKNRLYVSDARSVHFADMFAKVQLG